MDKLIKAAQNPKNHRYSASKGITKLRTAICDWYKRRYDVDLDPESETVVTIGSKEGLSHLALATVEPGDVVLTTTPAYPIHPYAVIIAGGEVRSIPLRRDSDFFSDMQEAYKNTWPRPKMLIINFPNNPTTTVVDLAFFQKIADFARENNIIVVHDLAYADLNFDEYRAPSFLQAKGAKDVGVEFTTLLAALDIANGSVLTQCKAQHRHQEFLSFLRHIEASIPANLEVHLICDNYATHKHPRIRSWLARRPRFHVHFTPTYSSWLNQVERWFALITERAIRRNSFTSMRELKQQIELFVQRYNADASPFQWVATADSILQKIERIAKRISATGH